MNMNKQLFLITFISSTLLVACGGNSDNTPSAETETNQAEVVSTTETSTKEPEKAVVAIPSVDRGASLYKRCKTCHTLNEGGPHKTGPNLYNIFGAKAGAKDGFRYSKTMRESGITWTDENLTAYIKNPAKFMPGNTMSFAGIRKDADLALLLEYMRAEMEK